MTQPEGEPVHTFAEFQFNEVSGELQSSGADGPRTQRIPPQPAKLLGHLIRRHPDIVGLEEIRELLWPDVHVEFEKSLHTCVRKIRVALGDSAAEPRFVETVPRRGYRFLAEATAFVAVNAVAAGADLATEPEAAPSPPEAHYGAAHQPAAPSSSSFRRAAIVSVLAAVLTVVLWRSLSTPDPAPGPAATRVAVMPFEPEASPSALTPGNDFAESLVHWLVDNSGTGLDVIGPTTTQNHPESNGALYRWIESDHIDYVINGRELMREQEPRVLVEIIRGDDGAHVWSQYKDQLPDGVEATQAIARALAEEIANPRRHRPK